MIERSGFEAEISAFDAGDGRRRCRAGQGRDLRGFLDTLGGVGAADDVRAARQRYVDAGATSPCVGPVPTTDFEATLEAGAELI